MLDAEGHGAEGGHDPGGVSMNARAKATQTKKNLMVTDHAVLRYLQRVGGFDIDTLRGQIAERVSSMALPGAKAVVIDGYRYHLDFNERGVVVTTVTPIEG